MTEVEIISFVAELRPPMTVEMDPEDASRRAYALKSLGDRLYELVKPVQCKRGEHVKIDPVPKYLVKDVRQVSPAARPRPAEPASSSAASLPSQSYGRSKGRR